MLGAIIGDIAGSTYEYPEFVDMMNGTINVERRKEVLDKSLSDLLSPDSFFSDDTVLTVAIADAIVSKESYAKKLREYGKKYINLNQERSQYFESSFSPNFRNWLTNGVVGSSDGNGAGMRVSPVGFLFDDLQMVCIEAKESAIPSHNTEQAICGAQAIATVIYLARNGVSKYAIKEFVESKFGYNLDVDLNNLRMTNIFYPTCEVTVPQAIAVFIRSSGFEDGIKKAISIGGDTDTIACMTGAMLEAYYGLPQSAVKTMDNFGIPSEFFDVLEKAYWKM